MRRGSIDVMVRNMPAGLEVFDDGLLLVAGSKGARAGVAFGALGALAGAAVARNKVSKRRGELEALRPDTAQAASSVAGTTVVPLTDISSVEIKKPLMGSGRSLVVHRATGKKVTLVFMKKKYPTENVVALLRPLLGERLTVADKA